MPTMCCTAPGPSRRNRRRSRKCCRGSTRWWTAAFVWLVAADATGVLGFGYYAPFRERSAYRFTVEDSIYVREDVRGQGVGKALVARLIELATAAGLRQMIAVIGDSENVGSIGVHASLGFPYGRHDEIDRHQIRPLARCGHDAAPAGQGRLEFPADRADGRWRYRPLMLDRQLAAMAAYGFVSGLAAAAVGVHLPAVAVRQRRRRWRSSG